MHLTTIFPEIRLKRYLEMCGADGGPWANICALPALWVRFPGLQSLRSPCSVVRCSAFSVFKGRRPPCAGT